MRYNVVAQQFNRNTGRATGPQRTEEVNTTSNVLFKGCNDCLDVKQAYEAFWNGDGVDVVFVASVLPVGA